jgi:hypothetical protein
VIEKSVLHDEGTEENLRTCHLRGWVEPIANTIPRGKLTADGSLPPGFVFSEQAPLYRLTDSGWNAIHRAYVVALLSLIVAFLALGVAVIGLKP